MLKFQVFEGSEPAGSWPLRNAYLVGSDGNAIRCDILFEPGLICCEKRESGAAALALQHKVGDLGELTIQTCLLPERDEPYLLTLELARHRLMTLYNKLEDWAMFDLADDHVVTRRTAAARDKFLEAISIQHEDPATADKLAFEALTTALDGTEELALAHSELLLNKRVSTSSIPQTPIACSINYDKAHDRLRGGVQKHFDLLHVPTPWKVIAPEENEFNWGPMDVWTEWANVNRMPVMAGPLISFEPSNLPDWIYIWEHDYDTIRDLVYEHVERVVVRYRDSIKVWNVLSGLHVNSHFTFNFEQLMDLTRMTTMLVKKAQPNTKVIVEISQPFGEYFATNQRSIPTLMYADLLVQSGIQFDLLGIRLPMGQALPGQYTRDLMQISNMLDTFSHFGKPIALTCSVPSEPVTQMMIAAPDSGEPLDPSSGYWRRPWSPTVQSHWLEAVYQIALSKPYIETIVWDALVDNPEIALPLSGLIDEELQPKAAMQRLIGFRKQLKSAGEHIDSPSVSTKHLE
ncbi:endo-1,4-beta-xylanase [Poriferisphaera sp. WC338]|uniref:endo-1,4-beta-xylanase n=1 Tax=Poriferisphaera sp. WC338 TaxID=3425129 RepID=UPI003D816EDC